MKLVLIPESGTVEEFFVIPTKSKRDLLIHAVEKGERKVWDKGRVVEL